MKKYEKIFFSFAIILCLTAIGINYLKKLGNSDFLIAEVFKNNSKVQEICLDQPQTIVEGAVTLEVKNKAIRVKSADCPLQTCVKTGWISKPAQVIVCLPNKLLIRIKGNKKHNYDATSY